MFIYWGIDYNNMNLDIPKLRKNSKKPHHLITTSDNKTLFLREWKAEDSSKVAILIFHGITAYSEPYNEIALPLTKEGYNVFGLDLRGHGLSDGNRGDMPSKERLIRDLCEVIDFLKNKFSTLIVFGHSLGVISAFIALKHCEDKLDGLILLSAARKVREGAYNKPSFSKKLKILYNSIVHKEKPVIDYYREGMRGLDDPLFNFKYTLRFLRILSPESLSIPEKIEIPVILGVGDQDELFEVESAKALYEEIPSETKNFFILKGAKHAEFPEGSFSGLINWLNSNFPID